MIKTNASDYAVAGIISQYSSSKLLHPLAFQSQNLHNSELNYENHDKELLAIVFCLQKWCSYLLSISKTFRILTCRQAQSAEFLSEFHFNITYLPRKLAVGKAFANNNPNNVQNIFSPITHSDSPKVYLNLMTLHLKTLKLQDSQLKKIVVPDNPSL
ncbi:uncharacterized protein VP01_11503g1, partial [Puccinia sorghi]